MSRGHSFREVGMCCISNLVVGMVLGVLMAYVYLRHAKPPAAGKPGFRYTIGPSTRK